METNRQELDLVPSGYRRLRWLKRMVWRFGCAYVVMVITVAGTKWFVGNEVHARSVQLDASLAHESSLSLARDRIAALEAQHAALAKQGRVLSGLRGGPPIQTIFKSMNAALLEDVWFENWRFMRAGEFLEPGEEGVHAGFIILADPNAGKNKKAWRPRTHMEIKAKALTHSALASFVGRLLRTPIIEDVRVLNTLSTTEGKTGLVSFELAVVLADRRR